MSRLYCVGCQKAHNHTHWKGRGYPTEWICGKWYHPSDIEVVPESLRKEREAFAGDTLPRYRSGEFSAEWARMHPKKTQAMVKEGIITKEQVKNARDVWKDVRGNKEKVYE